MPKLIRLYIDSVLVGLALAIGFMALLVLLNVAQLRHLILGVEDGYLAAALVVIFFGGLFSSVQFAVRVVMLAVEEDRAVARRKQNGWGRSPRDRRDRYRDGE